MIVQGDVQPTEATRRLLLFTAEQFYAIIGDLSLPEDPYGVTLPDILNERSAGTHRHQDHEHKSGKVFLTNAEVYSPHSNFTRLCRGLKNLFLPLDQIRGAIDIDPDRYRGNAGKRHESGMREQKRRLLRFTLQGTTMSGVVDEREIYRKSSQFIGLSDITLEEEPLAEEGLPLSQFLRHVGCPMPGFMTLNMRHSIHS